MVRIHRYVVNRFAELEAWYTSQCTGVWEHRYGVKIDSLDNPGWWVKIDLAATQLEHVPFSPRAEHHSDGDWLDCEIKDDVFEGAGDPSKLEVILGIFLDWASQHSKRNT